MVGVVVVGAYFGSTAIDWMNAVLGNINFPAKLGLSGKESGKLHMIILLELMHIQQTSTHNLVRLQLSNWDWQS